MRFLGAHSELASLVPLCWALLAQPVVPPVTEPVDVLVAPVQVAGTLPPRALSELQVQLDVGLAHIEASVARLNLEAPCDDGPCLSRAARDREARYVLWPKVGVVERDYTVTLELLDASDGRVLATVAQKCEVCGVQEAAETLGSLTATMGSKIDALELGPAVLTVTSRPPGAVIEVDGEPAGRTPIERELEDGDHWVSARLDGYVTQRQQVQLVRGVREGLELELVPLPVETERGRGKLEVAGWSLLGVGAAGIATGVVLVVLEERPNRTRCDGENVDPMGECKFRYATLEAGIGTLAVGGVLAITGLTLGLVGRKRPRRTATSAMITRTTAGFSVRGRF